LINKKGEDDEESECKEEMAAAVRNGGSDDGLGQHGRGQDMD